MSVVAFITSVAIAVAVVANMWKTLSRIGFKVKGIWKWFQSAPAWPQARRHKQNVRRIQINKQLTTVTCGRTSMCVFVRACVWSAMYVLPSPASELKQMPQHTGCAYKFFTKYVGIGAAGLVLSCIGCLLCVSVCPGLCPWPGQNKQHKHTWHVQWVFKRTKLEHCLVRSVWGSQTSNGI